MPESPERNLAAEVDELTSKLNLVFRAVSTIGEQLESYKSLYLETAQKLTAALGSLEDSLEKQGELNHAMERASSSTLAILRTLDERISALENARPQSRPN